MRVLILSIYHDPEPIPKTGELARELQRRGHEVTVVTAFPHYPAGRLYPGYRLAPWRWEVRDGVRVLRTFIYPYHGRRSSLRMVNYLTWMLSSMQAAWLAPACDVLYVWHPPLTVGVSAWVISKLKRVRYVYDVQDLWPESALASGLMRPGPLVNALYRLADWVYARADRSLCCEPSGRRRLRWIAASIRRRSRSLTTGSTRRRFTATHHAMFAQTSGGRAGSWSCSPEIWGWFKDFTQLSRPLR